MKKVFPLLLTLALCLSLCACGGSNDTPKDESNDTPIDHNEAAEPSIDILGEWVSVADNTYTLTFLKDGTCFYTGTPPTLSTPNTITIQLGDGTVGTEASPYKYTFEAKTKIITIYSTISMNSQVITQNGELIIASINGDPTFVRAKNYEEYHEAYLVQVEAKHQEDVAKFFAEGKEGRTELAFDTAYAITDKLTLTATEILRGETADEDGKFPLFLHITLTNTTSESMTVRYGKDQNGNIKNSALSFGVNTYGYGEYFTHTSIGGDYLLTGLDDDFTRDGPYRDALTLGANAQNDYYIRLPRAKSVPSGSSAPTYYEPYYVVLSFSNIELYCNATESEKHAVIATTPTTKPTEAPTTKPTEAPTTAPSETPTLPAQCGHSYKDATCTTPQTCSYCGVTNGSALGHDYKDATCENPKTCTRCNITEGSVAGHIDNNGTCTICGKTKQGTENTEKVLNYLKANADKNVTAADVAAALGMEKASVDGIFTSAIQRKGLGVRIPAEIQLEDGTHKQVKYLSLTPAGMAYNLWS